MAVRATKERHQAILKKLNSLSGRYSRYQIWCDFVTWAALSISNAIDKLNAPQREEQAGNIVQKYTEAEKKVLSDMFAEFVLAMEEDPDQDFLGELFMMCEFGNDAGGQFFTPYDVCRAMAAINMDTKIKDQIKEKGFVSCNDCACGAGALLVAFANECRRAGINFQTSVLFVAQDIDYLAACMCYLQMSILGLPGYVYVGNTLTDPCVSADGRGLLPINPQNCFFTPMFFSDVWTWRKLFARIGIATERVAEEISEASPAMELVDVGGQFTFFD